MARGVIVTAIVFVTACTRGDTTTQLCEPVVTQGEWKYSDGDSPIPAHFISSTVGGVGFVDNSPPSNPISNAGATLGRVLFYDVRLSRDDRISCASCHEQQFGFSDTLRASVGHNGQLTARRTMALGNARFNYRGRFFWDERASSLENQVVQPIEDSSEMGSTFEDLVPKLSATSYYPQLFAAAYGSPEINPERISAALAQFVRSLVSAQSRYDSVFVNGRMPERTRLNLKEREGESLFVAKGCPNCHRTIAQFADKPNNNGLDLVPRDTGAGGGTFKPPSLRNVAVRPPYMHDGRFRTLREVVEFYDHGVRNTPLLDQRMRLQDGSVRKLGLNRTQVDAVVAFLESLTDSSFLHAEKFSNPFPCRQFVKARSILE